MDFLRRNSNPDSTGDGDASTIYSTPMNYKDLLHKLVSGTFTISDLINIQVKINGTPTINIPGPILDAINQFDGLASFATDNILRIPGGLYGMLDPRFRDFTNWNMGKASKSGLIGNNLEVKTTISGSTNAKFETTGHCSPASNSGPGMIRYITAHQFNISGTTEIPFTTPTIYGKPQSSLLRRVFFVLSGGATTMTRMRITWDGIPIWEADTDVAQRLQTDSKARTPGSFFALVAEFPPDGQSGHIADNGKADDLPFFNMGTGATQGKSLGFTGIADADGLCVAYPEYLGVIPA